jgi:PncC family amidohydrolase
VEHGLTLSLAESCTGGLISSLITKIPGSSRYFLGGFVTYSDSMKTDVLGVDRQIISEKSAVCGEVARQMCLGALKVSGSDYAIAVTGDAGPSGDQVGVVFGAIGSKNGVFVGKISGLEGLNREKIQKTCANMLLHALYKFVTNSEVPFANK